MMNKDEYDDYTRRVNAERKAEELGKTIGQLTSDKYNLNKKIDELKAAHYHEINHIGTRAQRKIKQHEAETGTLKAQLIKLKLNACTGCAHEPKRGDPYPTPCGECSRWWSDNFEEKNNG
jgi:chromosome segregation ATPase